MRGRRGVARARTAAAGAHRDIVQARAGRALLAWGGNARHTAMGVVDHWVNYPNGSASRAVRHAPGRDRGDGRVHGAPAARARLSGRARPRDRSALLRRARGGGRLRASRRGEARAGNRRPPDRRRLRVGAAGALRRRSADDPGYSGTQNTTSSRWCGSALADVAPAALMVVKLHPLEDPDAFHDLADGEGAPMIRVLRTYPVTHLISRGGRGRRDDVGLPARICGAGRADDQHPARSACGRVLPHVHRDLIESVWSSGRRSSPAPSARASRRPAATPHAQFGERAIERLTAVVYELAAAPGQRWRGSSEGLGPSSQRVPRGRGVLPRPLEREDTEGNWRHWFSDPEVTRFMFRGVFPLSIETQLAFYEHLAGEQQE